MSRTLDFGKMVIGNLDGVKSVEWAGSGILAGK